MIRRYRKETKHENKARVTPSSNKGGNQIGNKTGGQCTDNAGDDKEDSSNTPRGTNIG